MGLFRFALSLAGLVLAHLSLAPWIEVGGAVPDLPGLLVVHLALAAPFDRVYVQQWLVGMVKDLFGGGEAGLYASLYLLAGIVLSRFRSEFYAEHRVTQALVTFVVSLQVQVLAALLVVVKHPHVDLGSLVGRAVGIALYTALVAPLVLAAFRLDRRRKR